ncbi:hypothetical protein KP509_08G022900, partial [Ceratopteris richardii]
MSCKPGDWNCPSCDHLNFGWRESCQRCNEAKSGSGGHTKAGNDGYGGGRDDVRPGDWHCQEGRCGAHNFASRSNCFKCGSPKDEGGGGYDRGSRGGFGRSYDSGDVGSGHSGWKSGDWMCTRSGCNEHNFASRTECFRCQAPR